MRTPERASNVFDPTVAPRTSDHYSIHDEMPGVGPRSRFPFVGAGLGDDGSELARAFSEFMQPPAAASADPSPPVDVASEGVGGNLQDGARAGADHEGPYYRHLNINFGCGGCRRRIRNVARCVTATRCRTL